MRFERGPFGRIAVSTVTSEDDVALYALDILQNHVIPSVLPAYLRSQTGNVQICIDCTGYDPVSEIKMQEWDSPSQKRKCIADFLRTILIAKDFFLDVDHFIIDSKYVFFDSITRKLYWCYLPVINQMFEGGKYADSFFWENLELLLMESFFSDALEEEDRNQILFMFRDEREDDLLTFLSDFSKVAIHSEQGISDGKTFTNRLTLQFFLMAACFVLCVSTDWRNIPALSGSRWTLWYVLIFSFFLLISLMTGNGKRPSADLVLKRKEIESQQSVFRKNMYFPAVTTKEDMYSTESKKTIFSPAFLTQNLSDSQKSDKPMKAVIWVADFLIGSDQYLCDFCINHDSLSDRHARILFRKPLYFLVDLGSENGTWIGSRRLYSYEENPLTDGDTIVFGKIHFVFNHTEQV